MIDIRRILIGLAVSALLPTTAIAQKVSYDYDRSQDFSQLRTYAFKDTAPLDKTDYETTTYDSPFTVERVRAAIAAQLEGRGMKRDDENPDVYIVTRQTFEKMQNYYAYSPYGWGGYGYYGYGWGPGYTNIYVEDYVVGTLTIDVQDAATGELLWRGVGTKTVDQDAKPEKRDRKIVKAVNKIFKKYPMQGVVSTSGHNVPKPQ
jgi:hypothetical protein